MCCMIPLSMYRHHPWVNGAAMLSKCLIGILQASEASTELGNVGGGPAATVTIPVTADINDLWVNSSYADGVLSSAKSLLICEDSDAES
jgi:hypothetical protein